MLRLRVTLLALIALIALSPRSVRAQVTEQDSLALVALYSATNGAWWTNNTNWLKGPVSTWLGVTVSEGRVSELFLGRNRLVGAIPAELGNLTSLTSLDLGFNRLTGAIPAELGNLTSLTDLYLMGNQLTGAIPAELGNLTSLIDLDLSDNQLTGAIPAELGNLTSLTNVFLSFNLLTGAIPAELGNLTSLTRLHLHVNRLAGAIPAELGNLTSLTNLDLSENDLTGAIPAELGNLTSLTDLYLMGNQLTGAIPAELGNLTSLTTVYLSLNQLTGAIPTELGNLTSLTSLDLGFNRLTGAIPAELGNLTSLTDLYLMGNQLTGAIPAELGNLTSLTDPYLNDNQLESSNNDISDSIKASIRSYVHDGWAVRIAVGLVTVNGPEYYSYGTTGPPRSPVIDENTPFKIGSVHKVLTTTVLASMVESGEVSLDDPIQKFLPDGYRAPTRNGKHITLEHLATHTSGLPSDPPGGFHEWTTREDILALSDFNLEHDIGEEYRYSNWGMIILQGMLMLRTGSDWDELLADRLTNELGMSTFGFTAKDMLKFLAAHSGLTESNLSTSMKMTHEPRYPMWKTGQRNMQIGLGWQIHDTGDDVIISKGGRQGFYTAYAGFNKERQRGAVVLINTRARYFSTWNLGYQLLDPRTSHEAAAVDLSVLESYTGEYQDSGGDTIFISMRNDQLTAKLLDHPPYPLHAESATEFLLAPASHLSFIKNAEDEIEGFNYVRPNPSRFEPGDTSDQKRWYARKGEIR